MCVYVYMPTVDVHRYFTHTGDNPNVHCIHFERSRLLLMGLFGSRVLQKDGKVDMIVQVGVDLAS